MKIKKIVAIVATLGMLLGVLPATPAYAITYDGAVTDFKLVNATTDVVLGDLQNQTTVNLGCGTLSQINVVAETEGSIGSVRFALDGNTNFRTENVAPYALAGDTAGDYYVWAAGNGFHEITATPYSEANATGSAGAPLKITILVTDDCTAPVVTGVANGGLYNVGVFPTFTDGNATLSKDGGVASDFVSGTEVEEEGSYTLVVTDYVGNTTIVNFVIDKTAPMIPVLTSPTDGKFLKPTELTKFDWNDVTLDANSLPEGSLPVEYRLELTAGPVSPVLDVNNAFDSFDHKSPWLSVSEYVNETYFSTLGDGVYFWNVKSKDEADNNSKWAEPFSFTIDGTLPTLEDLIDVTAGVPIELSSVASDANGVSYKWEMVLGPGTVEFSSDKINNPIVSADTDGDYVLRLTVTDPAGNSVFKEMKFTWFVQSVVLMPLTPVSVASAIYYAPSEVLGDTDTSGEVKSDVTEEDSKPLPTEEEDKALPAFGIFVLVLLVLIGLYLLYLQKPEWFGGLLFWKKKKKSISKKK